MEFESRIKGKSLSEGTGKNGIWRRCEFSFDNGQKLSTFEVTIAEANNIGDFVKCITKTNMKGYEDLVSMEKKEGVAPVVNKIISPKQSNITEDLLRQILAEMKQFVALASAPV